MTLRTQQLLFGELALASDILGAKLMASLSEAHVSRVGFKPLQGCDDGALAGISSSEHSFAHHRAHSTHGNRGYDTVLLFQFRSKAKSYPRARTSDSEEATRLEGKRPM